MAKERRKKKTQEAEVVEEVQELTEEEKKKRARAALDLVLVKPDIRYRREIIELINEWEDTGDKFTPSSIVRNDTADFDYYVENMDIKEPKSDIMVPDTTFFCFDRTLRKIVGAISIRHYLNRALLNKGGHISFGIRHSERNKGMGTKLLELGIEECRRMGLYRILIICDQDNEYARHIIASNGGKVDSVIEDENGKKSERYWFYLSR
ncbi:MAG: GNAT family N-acetyltransferase [Clostridia bacterium]|nr:GNAT family N-acetyltransferase [Clostridia bacterium]